MPEEQKYKLRLLEIHRSDQQVYVENKENGDFFEINDAAAEAIEMMQRGMPLQHIQTQVAAKYPDEDVNVHVFLDQLRELGLIKLDDHPHAETESKKQRHAKSESIWSRLPVRFAKLFFHPIALIIYGLLFVRNVSLMIMHPDLRPVYYDIFIVESIAGTIFFLFIVSTVLVIFHELGHILAARAQQLSPRLGIGNRFFFLVMETDLGNIWKLPARSRYLPYLGGICFDQIMLCAALTVQLWAPFTFMASLGKIAVFLIVLTLLFQCCIFMKTDLYYVFENAAKAHNLQENAKNLFARFLPFLKANKDTDVFEGEENIVRIYAVFYAAGMLLMGLLFMFYFAPQMAYTVRTAMNHLHAPPGTWLFWDGIFALIFPAAMIALLAYVKIKSSHE